MSYVQRRECKNGQKEGESRSTYVNGIRYTGPKNRYQGNLIHNIKTPNEIFKAHINSLF